MLSSHFRITLTRHSFNKALEALVYAHGVAPVKRWLQAWGYDTNSNINDQLHPEQRIRVIYKLMSHLSA